MTLYCGIDLHSNNSVVAVLDEQDRTGYEKRKGQCNKKNGNKYLAWAFMEAGHYGAIWDPRIKRFYQDWGQSKGTE